MTKSAMESVTYRTDRELSLDNQNVLKDSCIPSPPITPATPLDPNQFRSFSESDDSPVKQVYRLNHHHQTLEFVLQQKKRYCNLRMGQMGIWEALEKLDGLVDESDPDTSLTQIQHAMQSAEAARRDQQPRWMILTALIHDLGKILFFYGEPQWAVVGDTFVVGCKYSDKIVYHELFSSNPDLLNPELMTTNGIYSAHCGLNNVHLSWGHDEYLYTIVKDYLPAEASYIIRYHSFYVNHKDGAYQHLMNEYDHKMMKYVKQFNSYDLYSKADDSFSIETLKPFYVALINEFFPSKIPF